MHDECLMKKLDQQISNFRFKICSKVNFLFRWIRLNILSFEMNSNRWKMCHEWYEGKHLPRLFSRNTIERNPTYIVSTAAFVPCILPMIVPALEFFTHPVMPSSSAFSRAHFVNEQPVEYTLSIVFVIFCSSTVNKAKGNVNQALTLSK